MSLQPIQQLIEVGELLAEQAMFDKLPAECISYF